MSLKLELIEKGLTPEKLLKLLPEIKRPAWESLGEHFHTTNMPRRFTYAGGRMLGYSPRSPRYVSSKFKAKRHGDPLRWSDTSRQLTLGIQDIRVKMTDKKSEVRVVIHARGLNRRHKKSTIRMQDEIRRIAVREFGPLTRHLDSRIDAEMKKRDLR